jgi:hypothetical protein
VLVYSFVGMNEITRTVGNTSSVNVLMQDAAKVLAGCGSRLLELVQKKSAISSATISAANIEIDKCQCP